MAISANSIIHYTTEFDTLKTIISELGFKMCYCLEKITTRGGKSYSFGISMTSFCDIPLTDYKKHFKRQSSNNLGYYGDYGIGLTKEWARKKGLNPVLYIDYNSFVGTALRKTIESYVKGTIIPVVDVNNFQKDDFALFSCYAKNYRGDLIRAGKLVKSSYCYYDEREWRYVPTINDIGNNKVILDGETYEKDKSKFNSLINSYRLPFELSDISYIIVKERSEILPLTLELKTKVSNEEELHFLISKIITSEQIIDDF